MRHDHGVALDRVSFKLLNCAGRMIAFQYECVGCRSAT